MKSLKLGKLLVSVVLLALLSTTRAGAQTDTEQGVAQEEFEILSAYGDYMNQVSDFSLSFMRYRPRGIDYRYEKLDFHGVRIENWFTGTPSWNVLGTSYTTDTYNYTGFRLGYSLSNRTYTHRVTANFRYQTDTTENPAGGWNIVLHASRRWGESLSVEGVAADNYTYQAEVSKEMGDHTLSLIMLYAPSVRAMASATTRETAELTGNNLYNPSWGMQGSRVRASRIRTTHQPLAILKHDVRLAPNVALHTTLFARSGIENTSALNWQNTANPYPDYYRYLPSFQTTEASRDFVTREWQENPRVRQIDFQNLYNVNSYNSPRARYASELRQSDMLQGVFQSSVEGRRLSGGIELSYAKNLSYKVLDDLMGAGYWLDVDSFVEMDDDVKEMTQNDLRNPNRKITPGEEFGYRYAMSNRRAKAWLELRHRWDTHWQAALSLEASYNDFQREGYYEKENFPAEQSFGMSDLVSNLAAGAELRIGYRKGGNFSCSATIGYQSLGPTASTLFISPQYRNATLPEAQNERISRAEFTADYRSENLRLRGTLYYYEFRDRRRLNSFYDDTEHIYTHYLMEGIDERMAGFEASAEFKIAGSLWGSIAVVLSDNRYISNPRASQWTESTGREMRRNETVYYENLHTASSPQNFGVFSLAYRPWGWNVSLSANLVEGSYIALSPLRRTLRAGDLESHSQEQLPTAVTLDLFGGKTFYTNGGQSFGIYIGINNLTDNRGIISSGYESSRMRNDKPMASKYYYALGINGFISLSYRF